MVWLVGDLAHFVALALTIAMRETPIIGVIDGGKQWSIADDETESDNHKQGEGQEKRVA